MLLASDKLDNVYFFSTVLQILSEIFNDTLDTRLIQRIIKERIEGTVTNRIQRFSRAFLGLYLSGSVLACAPLETNKVDLSDQVRLQTGILGYWSFDETTLGTAPGGKDFADSSGSGNHAAKIGNLTRASFGVRGNAVTSAVGGAITIPIDLSHEQIITLSLWVNPKISVPNAQNILFEYTPDSTSNDGFLASLDNSLGTPANSLLLWLHSPMGYFAKTTSTLAMGWHNVVTIFDRSNPSQNSITLYVDGNRVATNTSGALASNGGSSFTQSSLYLLCRAGTSSCLRADLDELMIWNRAVTPSEIQSLLSF